MERASELRTSVRVSGPTPNGGEYAILYYKGAAHGSVATPENAVGFEAVEFDKRGDEIFRSYVEIRR